MKNNKNKENKEPSKRKVGRAPLVPTDEDRAVVKLLAACGMAQDRICLRARGKTIVLTQFMAAINRG
jgi:hypothetical protein